MKPSRATLAVLGLLAATACDRGGTPARQDTVRPAPMAIGDSAASVPSPNGTWDISAGPLLLVAADSPDHAYLVPPDSGTLATVLASIPHPASVTLFGRGGTVQAAELPAGADADVCATATLHAAPPPLPWSVGFMGGVVSPLSMDSIETMPLADSTTIAVSLNRLASALANDPAGRFEGLPFVIRSIWRFAIPGSARVVVANMTRQINQEATPLQERTLLVAEQAAGDSSFTTAYSERSYGNEETIENREVLAAILLGTTHDAALVISRDYGDATAYGMLQRVAGGRWQPRWMSRRRHC